MTIDLSCLQREILDFARDQQYKASLEDFNKLYPEYTRAELEEALKGLRRGSLVSVAPGLFTSCIDVTQFGQRAMGWLWV